MLNVSQCNFASEAAVSNKTGSTMIRRTGSVARHGSEYNSNGASRGSMYFDDYVDEMVEDEADASEDDSSHSSNDYDDFNHESEPSRERVFVRVAATANNKSANTSPVKHSESHQEVKNHDFGDDDVSSAIIHDGKGQATAGEEEEGKKEDGENVKLETGLIDYCIILGKYSVCRWSIIPCVGPACQNVQQGLPNAYIIANCKRIFNTTVLCIFC